MQMKPLKVATSERVHVVGPVPLVLRDQYPVEQLWLPFVAAIVLAPVPPKEEKKKKTSKAMSVETRTALHVNWDKKINRNGPDMWLFHHVRDQSVLPFASHRKISANEWKRIIAVEYPGFIRTKSGKIATVTYRSSAQRAAMAMWCAEHCVSRYHFEQRHVYFADPQEAVLAKLHCA